MTRMDAHNVFVLDDKGNNTNEILANIHPASPESIQTVLDAGVDSNEGRSQFMWIRLNNGDLILGVYPQGDTYFSVEVDAETPREL